MWHKTLIAQALALLVLGALTTLPAAAQETNGVVQGQVVNWTQNGGNVSQIEVILDSYNGSNPLVPIVAITDAQGGFEFTGLATQTDYTYQLRLIYQDAEYIFESFSFDTDESTKVLTLVVYDSTSNDDMVSVGRAHMIVNVNTGSLEVTEYYLLFNDGDKTYVGTSEVGSGKRETLKFSLPAQATNRDYGGTLQPCCIVTSENGFSDNSIFLPGSKEIIFSYQLDYTLDSYALPVKLHYPVESFDLMVQGAHKFGIGCDQLTQSKLQGMDGTQITYYTGKNLKRDTTLDIRISGLMGESKGSPWMVIIPSVLSVGLVIGFVLWRVNRSKRVASLEDDVPIDTEERLLLEIAQLDDEFEKGNVPREDYLKQRNERKRQLVQLKQRRRS